MNILIRNIPEQLHRQCKAQAALDGQSLNAWIIQALQATAQKWVEGAKPEEEE